MGKVASIAAVQLFADPTSAAAVALGGVVVSVNTCANLVGRLSFGQIIDKLGAYKSLLISLVVTIVALVIMSMSFTQSMFFVALALLGFSFGALLVIYPPLTGGAFGTSNIGVNYGIMFLGYAASTWISQPITAVLYHAEAGSAAYQQSFYGAIVIAAIAVVLTVYMMVSDSKKTSIKESKCLSSTPSALPLSAPVPWAATTSALSPRSPKPSSSPSPTPLRAPAPRPRPPACRFTPIPPR